MDRELLKLARSHMKGTGMQTSCMDLGSIISLLEQSTLANGSKEEDRGRVKCNILTVLIMMGNGKMI